MAIVVYTRIEKIEDLDRAEWKIGAQDSYERTKKMAYSGSGFISLIGRQAGDGSVQLAFANAGRGWYVVSAWHLTLAKFFASKLDAAPKGRYLCVFFDSIDDDAASHAAKQLIGCAIGIDNEYEPAGLSHDALNQLGAAISELGNLPYGDWMFTPLRNTVFNMLPT